MVHWLPPPFTVTHPPNGSCYFEPNLFPYYFLSYFSHLPAYEDVTECSETPAYKIQTPGNYPKESIQHITLSYATTTSFPTLYTSLSTNQHSIRRCVIWFNFSIVRNKSVSNFTSFALSLKAWKMEHLYSQRIWLWFIHMHTAKHSNRAVLNLTTLWNVQIL